MSGTHRRSLRLIAAGYYTEEGTPQISYKERIYRVFKRRMYSFEDDSVSSGSSYDMSQTVCNLQFEDPRTTDNHSEESIPLLVQENETQTVVSGTLNTQSAGSQTTPTRQTDNYTQTYRKTIRTKKDSTQTDRTKSAANTTCSSPWFKICALFLVLLLNFGLMCMYIDMRVQQKMTRSLTQQKIAVPLADTMPNFALESQGARVIGDLSSETYWAQGKTVQIWEKVFYWWYSYKKHRTVIQAKPVLNPGECWPFAGDQGHMFVSLSHAVHISHVSLGHITKSQCPHGTISSAPRQFSVYGMTTTNGEGVFLGRHVYDSNGEAQQTFPILKPDIGVFKYVKLKIENNWGNSDNTCLYSFKVHGQLPM